MSVLPPPCGVSGSCVMTSFGENAASALPAKASAAATAPRSSAMRFISPPLWRFLFVNPTSSGASVQKLRRADPLLVVVAVEEDLPDREVQRLRRLDPDPGQEERVPAQVEALRGAEQSVAGEVPPGLPERLGHRPRDGHPVPVVDVGLAARGVVAPHDR